MNYTDSNLIDQWLNTIGKQFNATFKLDSNHKCFIGTSEVALTIYASPLHEHVYLTANLCERVEALSIDTLRFVLTANLFLEETKGMAIAIDPIANGLVLSQRCLIQSLNFESFQQQINSVIVTANHIQSLLQAHDNGDQAMEMSMANNGINAINAIRI
ncbi:CesT family type III secretion system chaperone [Thalassomonas sp. RHCl1]|uniref:CesT family type III secretion system chaperone n=1 Tax=Thalassomonas sp. RHCl1 TaxID=2995320 RepID=UPI00248D1EA7|nr:CesT family type III secretion system chaperone [Thalassomonas sp. RHCl1]